MVAKIESGKSIRGILHYNEDNGEQGDAKLILASGFAGDVDRMSPLQKYNRFKALTELNGKSKINGMHVSLNFDRSDRLDDGKLQQIALVYMVKIGFGEQKSFQQILEKYNITVCYRKGEGDRLFGRDLVEYNCLFV